MLYAPLLEQLPGEPLNLGRASLKSRGREH